MKAKISSIKEETPEINEFRIKLSKRDAKKFSFIRGQYVMLAFPDDLESKRAFSIVDYTPQAMELFVLIKKNGAFTQRMFNSKIGEKMEVFGPYGKFTLPRRQEIADDSENNCKPLVFIAGGIGITPIYSMLADAKINDYPCGISLFYSAKSPQQAALYRRLNELNSESIRINYNFTAAGAGSKRLTSDSVLREISDEEKNSAIFYICGPGAMIEGFRKELLEKGIAEERIRSEEFT